MNFISAKTKCENGFSLIELMVVISITALLVAFSHSKYIIFSAKAKQVEAKQNLNLIYTLTHSHIEENPDWTWDTPYEPPFPNGGINGGQCGETNEIGFVLTNCSASRYFYGLTAAGDGTFTAFARSKAQAHIPASEFLPFPDQPARIGILPEWCNRYDSWSLDHNRVLTHIEDAIKDCL